jgi:hypothetical protein
MGQVTIYLDESTEKKARTAARSEGVSLSKWVAKRICQSSLAEWPAFVRELAGAWPDLQSPEQIRKTRGKDLVRERM